MINNSVQLKVSIYIVFCHGIVMSTFENNILFRSVGHDGMLVRIDTHLLSLGFLDHGSRSNLERSIPVIFCTGPAEILSKIIVLFGLCRGATVGINLIVKSCKSICFPDMKSYFVFCRITILIIQNLI